MTDCNAKDQGQITQSGDAIVVSQCPTAVQLSVDHFLSVLVQGFRTIY